MRNFFLGFAIAFSLSIWAQPQVITEKQLDTILTGVFLTEDKHQAKEVKKLIEWSVKFMGCYIFLIKNGIKM